MLWHKACYKRSVSFAWHILALANFTHLSDLLLSYYFLRETFPQRQILFLPKFFDVTPLVALTTISIYTIICFLALSCRLDAAWGEEPCPLCIPRSQHSALYRVRTQKNICWTSEWMKLLSSLHPTRPLCEPPGGVVRQRRSVSGKLLGEGWWLVCTPPSVHSVSATRASSLSLGYAHLVLPQDFALEFPLSGMFFPDIQLAPSFIPIRSLLKNAISSGRSLLTAVAEVISLTILALYPLTPFSFIAFSLLDAKFYILGWLVYCLSPPCKLYKVRVFLFIHFICVYPYNLDWFLVHRKCSMNFIKWLTEWMNDYEKGDENRFFPLK